MKSTEVVCQVCKRKSAALKSRNEEESGTTVQLPTTSKENTENVVGPITADGIMKGIDESCAKQKMKV